MSAMRSVDYMISLIDTWKEASRDENGTRLLVPFPPELIVMVAIVTVQYAITSGRMLGGRKETR